VVPGGREGVAVEAWEPERGLGKDIQQEGNVIHIHRTISVMSTNQGHVTSIPVDPLVNKGRTTNRQIGVFSTWGDRSRCGWW